MKSNEPELLGMRTRPFGGPVQNLNVPKQDVPRRRKAGWVAHNEEIPEPMPPDIEVLELKVKDANVQAEKAEHAARIERSRADDAIRFLQNAKELFDHEAEVKKQIAKDAENDTIHRKCMAVLQAASEPIPFKQLLALASSPIQESYVRNTFTTEHVGFTPDGDRLIMLNPIPYLREKAEREQRAAQEKEAAIRARMEAMEGV